MDRMNTKVHFKSVLRIAVAIVVFLAIATVIFLLKMRSDLLAQMSVANSYQSGAAAEPFKMATDQNDSSPGDTIEEHSNAQSDNLNLAQGEEQQTACIKQPWKDLQSLAPEEVQQVYSVMDGGPDIAVFPHMTIDEVRQFAKQGDSAAMAVISRVLAA